MTAPLHLYVCHETSYRYSSRVDMAQHLAWLRPLESERQKTEAFALSIVPEPSQLAADTDHFGNTRHRFALVLPHEELHVISESHVLLSPRENAPDLGQSPPWEQVQASLRYQASGTFAPASEYLFASPFIPRHPQLADYARRSFPAGRPLLQGTQDLMRRIFEDFTYASDSTDVNTPVLTAFTARRGVCQDFAHIMIGALRGLGLPARYVSGYLLTEPPPGQPRLQGADASHAWVSVWCPVLGWVEFDPTNNLLPDAHHVVLGYGRDYGDVPPLKGVIRGGGEHVLKVGVSVVPIV